MPLVGIQFGAQRLSWQQAKSEYAAGSLPFPTPLISAMQDNRNDAVPTASVIAGCLRQFQLKRTTDYYEKPGDLLPSIFGTAFHALMEEYTEVDPEQRELIDIGRGGDDWKITPAGPRHAELRLRAMLDLGLPGYNAVAVEGMCDYLHEGVLIRDWKSKKFLSLTHTPPVENKTQVNIYNWLASESGYTPAPQGELVYVSQSWLSRHQFALRPVVNVRNWVRERLTIWADAELRGTLVAPLPQLFEADSKGKLPAPCGYCPVREACLAAWREGQQAPF